MKNFSKIFAFAFLIMLSGCEMSSEIDKPSDPTLKITNILNTVDFDGNMKQVEVQPNFSNGKATNSNARKGDGTVSINGHMDWYPNDSENTWKKSLNAINGDATSGKGQVTVKSNFWGDVHGSVMCAYAEGNEAVVAMYITQAPDEMNVWYNEGSIVWFRLTDNGEGKNAPADQHYNTIWYYPGNFETIEEAQDFLMDYTCEDLFWYGWGIPRDIAEGNFQIK